MARPSLAPPKMLEAEVKKICRAWIARTGAYRFSPVQMGYGQDAIDDFVCSVGNFYAVEYKRSDDKEGPTARQWRCLREVAKAYGRSGVVRSLDDLVKFLTQASHGDVFDRGELIENHLK